MDDVPAVSPCVQVAGHELHIFVESPPLIAALVRDIRRATRRVWLETYIILADGAGKEVAEALKDRARAGVDVRLLYDAIGSQTTSSGYFLDMQRAGVRVHCFHSVWEALWRFSFLRVLNRRNHRKVLVVDDRVAYFGGMNIVEQENVPVVGRAEHLPVSAGWRDVHLRIQGPQVIEVAESFFRSWRRARRQKVHRRPPEYRQALLAGGPESIQFFDTGPGKRYARAALIFTHLFRVAQRNITLSMAYFLPVGRVLRQLLRAHRRGAHVRVVVPGRSDVRLVQWATRYLATKLLRRRFHIYERQLNMLHSKVMVVDDQWTLVGSSNLDARSLWINLEFFAVIHSRAFARAVQEIVRFEIAHSQRLTLRQYLKVPWWEKWRDRLAWTLRWWL